MKNLKPYVKAVFEAEDSFEYLAQLKNDKTIDFQILVQLIWLEIDNYPYKIIFKDQLEKKELTQKYITSIQPLIELLHLEQWDQKRLQLFLLMHNTLYARLTEYLDLLQQIRSGKAVNLEKAQQAQDHYMWAMRAFWLEFSSSLKKTGNTQNYLMQYKQLDVLKRLMADGKKVPPLPEELWKNIFAFAYSEQFDENSLSTVFKDDNWHALIKDFAQGTTNTPFAPSAQAMQDVFKYRPVDLACVKELLLTIPHFLHNPEKYEVDKIIDLAQEASKSTWIKMEQHRMGPMIDFPTCCRGHLAVATGLGLLAIGIAAIVLSWAMTPIPLLVLGAMGILWGLSELTIEWKLIRADMQQEDKLVDRAKDMAPPPQHLRAYAQRRQRAHTEKAVPEASTKTVDERTPLLKAAR